MKKNNMWVLLIILVLSIGLLSGCSQAEMGLIDLMSEINTLDVYESQETVSIKLNALPSDLTEDDPATAAIAQAMMSKYYIKSNVRMDGNQQICDGTFYLVDSSSGAEKQVFSYIASGGTMYVKVDDFVAFAKSFGNEELNEQLAILGDAQYISISSTEMADLMSASGGTVTSFNLTDLQKQQALYQKMMEGLSEEAFGGYETGMVTKHNNDKFTLKIDKQSVIDNIEPFTVYGINNAEEINLAAKGFLQSLDAEELAMLSLNPQMRTAAIDGMDKIANDIIANREQYLTEVEGITAAAQQESGIIGDKTGMTLVVEKLGDKSYNQKLDFTFDISDPENPSDSMDFEINTTAEMNAIAPFTVTIPDTGVLSLTELMNKMPRVLKIATTQKQYTFNQGFKQITNPVEVRIVQGRVYLPVRAIGNAMNENVGWNPTIKQAYVIKNGKTINLAGSIFNSRSFIKIRDFEKLGYTVNWDSATKTATITAN